MGGCAASKDTGDGTRVFNVKVLDELEQVQGKARLVVAPEYLELHEESETRRWEIKHLRRYGQDTGLFTFEAGRHSSGGAGRFFLGTSKSKAIFKLVESYAGEGPQESVFSAGSNGQGGRVKKSPYSGVQFGANADETGTIDEPSDQDKRGSGRQSSDSKSNPSDPHLNYASLDLPPAEASSPPEHKPPPMPRPGVAYTTLDFDKMKELEEKGGDKTVVQQVL